MYGCMCVYMCGRDGEHLEVMRFNTDSNGQTCQAEASQVRVRLRVWVRVRVGQKCQVEASQVSQCQHGFSTVINSSGTCVARVCTSALPLPGPIYYCLKKDDQKQELNN